MENKTITNIIIFGGLLILSMIGFQSYYVFNKWSSENKTFHQTAYIALLNVAKQLSAINNSTLPQSDLIKQLTSNYYVVNINNRIDAGLLEKFLIEEFQRRELYMDFEYAIYDCQTDEMVYGDFCSIGEKEYKGENLGDLPKYDEFIYYFGVKFPSKTRFLIDSLSLAVIFSIISLLAIIFFVYSVVVILRQKRLSELQKDFINNMTHEFKTPISSIKLAAETMLKSSSIQSDPKLKQYTGIIRDQNERVNAQIEKILNIAKMEKNHFELNKSSVQLHQLIHEIVGPVQMKMDKNGGKIELDLQAEQPIVIADRIHLTNVITNLLDNAIKYSNDHPIILIATRIANQKLICSISDKGIGMTEDQAKKAFTKFYRVPTGNIHNVKGFGLGLYYVKNVCDAHQWDIQLKSDLGKGTQIQISF